MRQEKGMRDRGIDIVRVFSVNQRLHEDGCTSVTLLTFASAWTVSTLRVVVVS